MTGNIIDAIKEQLWDVIVIGTGVAGSTLGYALARSGLKVLFCEKGKSLLRPESGLRGNYAEAFFDPPASPSPEHGDILLSAGRSADLIVDTSETNIRYSIPFIGSGTGGSSLLYGYAMERFFPADFSPRKQHPGNETSTLPEKWPISYGDLLPYYEKAEQLYRIRGSADPCRQQTSTSHLKQPPALHAPSEELYHMFANNGLHPYRLPQACEFVPGCQGCQGFICPNSCKNDSMRICLTPALEEHEARLLDQCEVLKLDATANSVTGVVCRHQGKEITLRGKTVVLAAGALATPLLLLQSATDIWPNGIGNGSGLVGKNLMRHFIDIYAVLPKTRNDHPGNLKELAFNDFYVKEGEKFGTVQSFGTLPPAGIIVEEMGGDLQGSSLSWLSPFYRISKPLLRRTVKHIFKHRILFASIMEDLPYAENRVTLADKRQKNAHVRLEYTVHGYEKRRIQKFRNELKQAFKPRRAILIKQAENNTRIAHACGTCRFGITPSDSVLNRNNRVHGLGNLYVVDASFFPSSGGTNPALTLAANALRVADHILSRAERKS